MKFPVLLLIMILGASAARTEEPPALTEPTGWFFSAGSSVRSVQASFAFGHRESSLLNWERFFDPRSGQGNAGLYRGGAAPVTYDDGSVGPQNPDFPPGVARGQVDGASQILPHPLGSTGFANATIAFHTEGFGYRSETGSGLDLDGTAVGPSLQWGYRLGQRNGYLVNLVSGWSFLPTSHDTGWQRVVEVFEDQLDFTYLYDYIADAQAGQLLPGPIDSLDHGVIYDATLITPVYGPGYQSPRQSISVEEGTKPRFYAVSRADLDVRLQEIPFGVEAGRRIGPFECALTGGATLNIIDYDLNTQLAWYARGASSPQFVSRWRDAGNPIKAGLFGGISAKLFLNPNRRIYLDGSTSYRWVDPVHASAGVVDVEIDVSSWEGRLGIGFILD